MADEMDRWRLVELSGETIDTGWLSTRIYDHLDMGWLCDALPDAPGVQWPHPWVRFAVGTETFMHYNRIASRSTRRVTDLMTDYGNDGLLIITAIRLQPPKDFDDSWSYCTCDFPGVGCCTVGRRDITHLHGPTCRACGTNGCCRGGECGHACCEGRR